MGFSYKPLWKLLIDNDMMKKDLTSKVGISKSTVERMSRSENVSLDIIEKICSYFHCSVNDVIEYVEVRKEEDV